MAARRAVEQELTRSMILDAARELFVKQGYQQTSMRQLAKVLGYSHGAIYYHFTNKAELYYALVKEYFPLLNQKLDEVMQEEADDPIIKLKKIFLGFIQFGLENQSHYQIMFLIKDEELNHLIQQEPLESYNRFAQAVSTLCKGCISPAIIWSVFLSLHGFVAHYCKSGHHFENVKSMAESHVSFLVKGLQQFL